MLELDISKRKPLHKLIAGVSFDTDITPERIQCLFKKIVTTACHLKEVKETSYAMDGGYADNHPSFQNCEQCDDENEDNDDYEASIKIENEGLPHFRR